MGENNINANSPQKVYRVYSSKYFGVEPEPVNPRYIDLDFKMQLGYKYWFERNYADCIRTWQSVWKDLVDSMEKESVSTFKEFDEIFNGNQYVSNWVNDFDVCLEEVLNKPLEAEVLKEYGYIRIRLNSEILKFLREDDQLVIENARRAIADTNFKIGDHEKGEELFKSYLDNDPEWGWGWIGWSDQYWLEKKDNIGLKRAEELLLKALSLPGLRDREDVEERLLDFYERTGDHEKFEALKRKIRFEKEQRKEKDKYQGNAKQLNRFDVSGEKATRARQAVSVKVGRNEPCPCGSGKKYKMCCGS